jgi:hypothetical protein
VAAIDAVTGWCAEIEGAGQGPSDAAHWVRVYSELLQTMTALSYEVPEMRTRVDEMRARLRYWRGVKRVD